ncbi:MAG: cysteine hydrolase family protein [Pseudomonadota bacterium]
MIPKFETDAALLLIDVQVGVNDLTHWGGPTGRRNNPDAEERQRDILAAFRGAGLSVFFTRHDSREAASPLKFSLPGGAQIAGLEPRADEVVIEKDVNSGFIGTGLEIALRREGVRRLVVGGFFTNFCVETTVRMAGNMGFDVYLAEDACATTNRVGPDGADHDPALVHDLSVASMHGEFCTALATAELIALCAGDAPHLARCMGNE